MWTMWDWVKLVRVLWGSHWKLLPEEEDCAIKRSEPSTWRRKQDTQERTVISQLKTRLHLREASLSSSQAIW